MAKKSKKKHHIVKGVKKGVAKVAKTIVDPDEMIKVTNKMFELGGTALKTISNPVLLSNAVDELVVKTKDYVSPEFYKIPRDVSSAQMMMEFDLDTLSKRDMPRIEQQIAKGVQVVFVTSKNIKQARDMLASFDLAGAEKENVFLFCEEGRNILRGNGKAPASLYYEVKSPLRNEDGSIKLDEKGLPKLSKSKTKFGFNKDQIDYVDSYSRARAKNIKIEYDGPSGRVAVLDESREEQVFQALNILNIMSLSPQQQKEFGISFTTNGLQLKPMAQSDVNATYTACSVAGIEPKNIRQCLAGLGQVTNNTSVKDFLEMFVNKDGVLMSPDEARESGRIQKVVKQLQQNVELEFLSMDKQRLTGSFLARWRPSTRKGLAELNRVNRGLVGDAIRNFGKGSENYKQNLENVHDAMYEAMMPMYDHKDVSFPGKVSYAKRMQALNNIKAGVNVELSKKDVKNFDHQIVWQHETINSVLNFIITPPPQQSLPRVRGRISSFFVEATGRATMPERSVADFNKFHQFQQETFDNLTKFSQYLQEIDIPTKRAELSLIFSGFMIGLEREIAKGATQQSVLEKCNEFVDTHMIVKKDEATITPSIPTPSTPPSKDDGKDKDGKDKDSKDKDRKDYIAYRATTESIDADESMLRFILSKYDGDAEKAERDPAYMHFSESLEKHKKMLADLKSDAELKAPEDLDEEKLALSISYVIKNTAIFTYNDIVSSCAEVSGKKYLDLQPGYNIPKFIKGTKEFNKVVCSLDVAVSRVALKDIDSPIIHNRLLERTENFGKYANSNMTLPAPEFDKDFEFLANMFKESINDSNNMLLKIHEGKLVMPYTPGKEDEDKRLSDFELMSRDVMSVFETFSYVPATNMEQARQKFEKVVLNMNNDVLYAYNRYNSFITKNMEEHLKKRGFTDSTTLNALKELNNAFPHMPGLTQTGVSAFKRSEMKNFAKNYNEIAEKYKDNQPALKQAMEILMFQIAESKRLDIYRKSVRFERGNFTFLGRKAPTEDELLQLVLKEDMNGDTDKVLAMINLTSQNIKDYNIYSLPTKNSFEQTKQQFTSTALSPAVDNFRMMRPFSNVTLSAMNNYLVKYQYDKTDALTYEIFDKLSSAWSNGVDVDALVSTKIKAPERDAQLKEFNKQYKALEKLYGNKAEFKKAQDMVTLCLGQATALTEEFRKEHSRTPWQDLQKANKEEFAWKFADELEEDRDTSIHNIRSATLLAQVFDETKTEKEIEASRRSKRRTLAKEDEKPEKGKKETPEVKKAEPKAEEAKGYAKTEGKLEKTEETKLEKPSKPNKKVFEEEKHIAEKEKKQPKTEEVFEDASDKNFADTEKQEQAMHQFMLVQGINSANNIQSWILANNNGDKSKALKDVSYAKLVDYVNSAKKELKNNVTQNGNLLSMIDKNDPQVVRSANSIVYLNTFAYNKIAKMQDGNAQAMPNVVLDKQEENKIEQEFENSLISKGEDSLAPEQQELLRNIPMWAVLLEEDKKQKEAEKQKQEEKQATKTNPGQTNLDAYFAKTTNQQPEPKQDKELSM